MATTGIQGKFIVKKIITDCKKSLQFLIFVILLSADYQLYVFLASFSHRCLC